LKAIYWNNWNYIYKSIYLKKSSKIAIYYLFFKLNLISIYYPDRVCFSPCMQVPSASVSVSVRYMPGLSDICAVWADSH